jgi:segregation and condensation protein B
MLLWKLGMGMDDGEAGMIASLAEMRVIVDNTDAEERAEELRILEALLFAAEEPLDEKALAGRLPAGVDVHALLLQLQNEYATRGVNLVRVGGKWSLRTASDLAWLLTREMVVTKKLSRAAIETLAIVAYHQPVTRAEIEEIRGVTTSKGTLDVLLETGWIRLRGRRKAPGRPVTYGTTEAFMSHFGLDALADLPGIDELKGAGLIDKSLPASPYRCRPTIRRSGRMKTRWNRETSILVSCRRPNGPRNRHKRRALTSPWTPMPRPVYRPFRLCLFLPPPTPSFRLNSRPRNGRGRCCARRILWAL